VEYDDYLSPQGLKEKLHELSERCRNAEHFNESLRNAISSFRRFAEISARYVCTFSPNGLITSMNEAMARLLSKHPIKFDANKSTFYDYVHQDGREELRQRVNSLTPENNVLEVREKVITVDSQTGWMTWILEASFDERGVMNSIKGVGRDITELATTNQVLQNLESRYWTIIDTMNEGFIEVDRDLHIVYANKKFCEMSGYKLEEILGRHGTTLVDKPFRAALLDEFRKRKQGLSGSYQLPLLRKDGKTVQTLLSPRPKYSADGTFAGSYSVVIDISHVDDVRRLLAEKEEQVKRQGQELAELRAAIKAMANEGEERCSEIEATILRNIELRSIPIIRRLRSKNRNTELDPLIETLERSLREIASPVIKKLSQGSNPLSHSELQVANLIREGLSTKRIAETLSISERTVEFHRRNIRLKLGLRGMRTTLKHHLVNLT
jgi:PAS domain S-box-containing protein